MNNKGNSRSVNSLKVNNVFISLQVGRGELCVGRAHARWCARWWRCAQPRASTR